jgi:hypothetical protein
MIDKQIFDLMDKLVARWNYLLHTKEYIRTEVQEDEEFQNIKAEIKKLKLLAPSQS